MAVPVNGPAYNGLRTQVDLQDSASMSRQSSTLLEYIKLYSDPQAKDQLIQFLQYHASELQNATFYDAAIVYAAADRDLALEIKHKLSELSLENKEHPRICLYDEEDVMSSGGKLPKALIDRCALILLLLTENFESDGQVQFVNQQMIENTRFCEEVPHWQFYCVRPLHTKPAAQRLYSVPAGMEDIRSYQVHDMDNAQETEKLESLFNCYSWFRKNHEKRCCVSKKELSETQQNLNKEVSSPFHNVSAKAAGGLIRGDSWCLKDVNGQESLDSVSDIETCSDSASSEVVEGEGHFNLPNGHGTCVNGALSLTAGRDAEREADNEHIKGRKHREVRQTTHRDTHNNLHGEISDSMNNTLHDTGASRLLPETSESLSYHPLVDLGHQDAQFYDAVIVFPAADRDLALEIRKTLSSWTLENNQHPNIALYDDKQFTRPGRKLPDALIDKCALILLILTENFEDDKRVQFVKATNVANTRFKGINHWQFYCVRLLHTEPERVRSYCVPYFLSSVRSYDAYNLDNPDQKNTLTHVFNCYSWFRGNREVDDYHIDDGNTPDSGNTLSADTVTPGNESRHITHLEANDHTERIISENNDLQTFQETHLVHDVPNNNSSNLQNVTFYDAAIVYAAADRNLALEIRNKMSSFSLKNSKHPKICLYDEKEFTRSIDPLPNVLVNRCALILLLLTEDFEDDENIQFVNANKVPNTRFKDVQHWQFYCVRPLHTKPKIPRFYSVPALMTDNRSYDVFDIDTLEQKEALEEMFNCYSWFRENQEGKLEQDLKLLVSEAPEEAREETTEEESILLEYLHLCNDPNSAHKLKEFVNEHKSQLQNIKFYDAAIVYSTKDTDLATDIKSKLSCLKLANDQYPKVCLYDQLESEQNLPNIIINRCALILLLLTENFPQDEKLHFLNRKCIRDTRFGDEFEGWQFYCVRVLHTQPELERSYNIPNAFSSICSYTVHDIEAQQGETFKVLFEMYSWFRRGHEGRCAADERSTEDPHMFEVTAPVVSDKSDYRYDMTIIPTADTILDLAQSVENIDHKQELTVEELIADELLTEYMQLCFDPAARGQLKEFLKTNSSKLPKDAFYDAAIVYSAEDRNLALEIKDSLSNLLLQNNEQPRVCLYDEIKVGSKMKLSQALINRCALIFLLLTQNFEEDDEIQFISAPVANSPRFDQTVKPWQFYCVRPLHTQEESVRCYEVPEGLESVRSYNVYNQDTKFWGEFERVFNSYQWFRRGHEERCYRTYTTVLNHSQLEPNAFDSEKEKKDNKEITGNHEENIISGPKYAPQLKIASQEKSAKPLRGRIFDAAIVYASTDRNLALEIRNQLSSLNLDNRDNPRICLYDDVDLVSQEKDLPRALIDQCALILLLLTENFDDDKRVQFVNTEQVESTRFAGVQNWQFYCVRPLHTQPLSERCYKVPAHLEANRSYEVYNLESQHTQEMFQDVFNCYSWFRQDREKKISNTEEHTNPSDDLLQESDKADVISDLSEMSSDIVDQQPDMTLPGHAVSEEVHGTKDSQHCLTPHEAPVEVSAPPPGQTSDESGSDEDLDTEAAGDVDQTYGDDVREDNEVTQLLSSQAEGFADLDPSTQTSSKQALLSEYIKLCSDPAATKKQLNDFLKTNATQLSGSSFYDAAIVYAAADRNVALEMKNQLSSLILENKEHPRICLYDGEELQGPDMKLPNVLIDRCALILLLLTDNFEQDENVQFLKEPAVSNTRFCEDISNWQDYCVRPLHTKPQSERNYAVPFNLAPIHSYDVFDLTTQHARDKMEGLFNCYTWFRVNHERRCRVSEERERKRSAQTVESDVSSPGDTTGAAGSVLDLGSPQKHYKPQDSSGRKRSFKNSEPTNGTIAGRSADEGEITPAISTQPEHVVVVSAEVLVRTPTQPVNHDDVFDETGDGNSEETLKLLQGGTDEELTPEAENTPGEHLNQLLHQDKERQPKERSDKHGFCCGCLSFLRWGRKSRKSEGVSFMELVDHD